MEEEDSDGKHESQEGVQIIPAICEIFFWCYAAITFVTAIISKDPMTNDNEKSLLFSIGMAAIIHILKTQVKP